MYPVKQIDDAFIERNDVLTTFLDISDAFSNVVPEILLEKLASIKCSELFIKFAKFLLEHRIAHTSITRFEILNIYLGVPCGGVLSTICFIIYISIIGKKIPKQITVLKFADDLALSINTEAHNMQSSILQLENTIKIIKEKLHKHGLSLAPKKTKFVHFNKRGVEPGSISLKVGNCSIPSCE